MPEPEDDLRVITVGNQDEVEMVQQMLRQEGIKSMVRLSRSFDIPGFGAGAPHELVVLEPDYERAHELVHGHAPD